MMPSRRFLLLSTAAGSAALLTSCASSTGESASGSAEGNEKEVTANEDLMREHGVLRRALLVYHETAPRLRADPASVPPDSLARTAQLFRTFGEDYHERAVEEPFVFPEVKRAGGPAASDVDVLLQQHERGRQITDYILSVTRSGRIGTGDAEPLAVAMENMMLMYTNHTAREDTIVFPAWKAALSERQYDEMGDRFEEIEKRQFGHDGFDDAVQQISAIEQSLGLADLAQFTAPPPPAARV
jgi:hemerythrin-like domain-containing protein